MDRIKSTSSITDILPCKQLTLLDFLCPRFLQQVQHFKFCLSTKLVLLFDYKLLIDLMFYQDYNILCLLHFV